MGAGWVQAAVYLCTVLVLTVLLHVCQDAASWGIKLEALKLVQTFVQFFSKLVAPHLPPLMAQAWQLFVGSLPIYQHLVINNSPDLEGDQVIACRCCSKCCAPNLAG